MANPVLWTDPSGRCLDIEGDGFCDYPETARGELAFEPKRSGVIGLRSTVNVCILCGDCFEDIPSAEIIGTMAMLQKVDNRAVQSYRIFWNELDKKWLEPDGRLRDDVLIALIMAEFSNINRGEKAYREAREAVANQYHTPDDNAGRPVPVKSYSNGCHGSCDSVFEQVRWIGDIEALRDYS